MRALVIGESLPFFYERATPADVASTARQLLGRKFDVSLILGVARRCFFGYPIVIVCSPVRAYKFGLFPFPTSFWLTCPWLVRLASQIESRGGVDELGLWIECNAPQKWIPYNIFHQRLRLSLLPEAKLNFLRRFHPKLFAHIRETGVGGLRFGATTSQDGGVRVKCLHLQAASWLALRKHPGEGWLRVRELSTECGGRDVMYCVSTLPENI